MARGARLIIDGVEIANLYQVSWGVRTHTVEVRTHRGGAIMPSTGERVFVIRVLKQSDRNTFMARWAADSAAWNRKAVELQVVDFKGDTVKVIRWKEGWVSRYREVCPHIGDQVGDQMYEEIEITCFDMRLD